PGDFVVGCARSLQLWRIGMCENRGHGNGGEAQSQNKSRHPTFLPSEIKNGLARTGPCETGRSEDRPLQKPGSLLAVKQQENTQYDQRKGPEPREKHLPAGPHFRAAFEQADRESGNRETQMLSLDALHDGHVGHVIPATHPAAVLVKEEKAGAEEREERKDPGGPCSGEHAARSLDFNV